MRDVVSERLLIARELSIVIERENAFGSLHYRQGYRQRKLWRSLFGETQKGQETGELLRTGFDFTAN